MSAADIARIRLGTAPDSWGVWHPDHPQQTPWHRFLDEVAEAGYEWIELGPYGYLPTDPSQLQEEVGKRGLKASGQAVLVALHRQGAFDKAVADAREACELITALGARHLVTLPEGYTDGEPPYAVNQPTELDDEAWARLTGGMNELAKIIREEYDVTLSFHSHADSHVETPREIERFLAETDPALVPLCLDTGHVAYGGGDSVELITQYPDRIGYVHLKSMDPQVFRQVKEEGLAFPEAVQRGAFVEPPAGVPDMEKVADALRGLDVDLFAIVEQDLFPCHPDVPLPIATRTRGHLRSCGIG